MTTLSLYDLTGIQRFVFGSNRLRQNLGGSWLVSQALDAWLPEIAKAAGAEHRWSGGGNGVVVSPSGDLALRVATSLSARLIEQAPGLGLACAHVAWSGEDNTFQETWFEAQRKVAKNKRHRWPDATFDGGGVVAPSAMGGAASVGYDDQDHEDLSSADQARRGAADQARGALASVFKLPSECQWTPYMEELGRSHGERSFVGVVCFDGNGMGRRFHKAATSLEKLHTLSAAVRKAGLETLKRGLGFIADRLEAITDVDRGGFALHENQSGERCFPVRPILYGGDDITLVCDGRLALDLAAELLRAWHEHTAALPGGPAHACVGVALVKTQYPFFRAYELASELCKESKKAVRKADSDASAMDWEIVAGGGLVGLEDRRRVYSTVGTGAQLLHARPYYVCGRPPADLAHRDWRWFREELVRTLQEEKEELHTQLRGLAEVLQRGPQATGPRLERLRDRLSFRLPEPKGRSLTDGFAAGETPYLDAIELMDRAIPWSCLANPNGKAPGEASP